MERYENFNSPRARNLGIAQIVFIVLTLILGIAQAANYASWCIIAPVVYTVFQIAPTACGMLASREQNKSLVVASMVLNILTAIFGSFNQICYSIAMTAISGFDWSEYDQYRSYRYYTSIYGYTYGYRYRTYGSFGFGENFKGFTITCAILMLFGLALFIVNIWAAVLGYVSCSGSQSRVGQYPGGHIMMIQQPPAPGMQNYPQAPVNGMQGYAQAPGTVMQGYHYPQQYFQAPGPGMQGYPHALGNGAQGYAPAPGIGVQGSTPVPGIGAEGSAMQAQTNPASGAGVRPAPIQSAKLSQHNNA